MSSRLTIIYYIYLSSNGSLFNYYYFFHIYKICLLYSKYCFVWIWTLFFNYKFILIFKRLLLSCKIIFASIFFTHENIVFENHLLFTICCALNKVKCFTSSCCLVFHLCYLTYSISTIGTIYFINWKKKC